MDTRIASHTPCWLWAAALLALQQGCSLTNHLAYTNKPVSANKPVSEQEQEPARPKASFKIVPRAGKRQPEVLVLLALSGGGSRAAYFSARTMHELERITASNRATVNALEEVDLISSVSGGSLAAAYYASSVDPGKGTTGQRVWDEQTVRELMRQDYIGRWIGNWFWPLNVGKFWFTAFDRTDIMAQTFADNFFDRRVGGVDLTMNELNPERPNLVLNSTIGSRTSGARRFGSVFTFTDDDFRDKINSDIGSYEIARAVMASATFPAAFNYMTLRDFHRKDAECDGDSPAACYLHVFDGGNSDNLGLLSLKRVLLGNDGANIHKYQRIAIVFVDAYRDSGGVSPKRANPRSPLDYIVDSNFMDATDSLLEANRKEMLANFFSRSLIEYKDAAACARDNLPADACVTQREGNRRDELLKLLREKLFFFHVNFQAVPDADGGDEVRSLLNEIPTTFKLEEGEARAIETGVARIFSAAKGKHDAYDCVQRLADLINAPTKTEPSIARNLWCGGEEVKEERAQKLQR